MLNRSATGVVGEGASILDGYFGSGSWREDLNLDILDINDVNACVLGQLFGEFYNGADTLRNWLNEQDAMWGGPPIAEIGASRGFDVFGSGDSFEENRQALNAAWRDEVNEWKGSDND